MLAHVTNLAPSPRGFDTGAGGIALVDPGETLLLDLADHPAHRAWEEAGDVTVAPVPDKEARAMRKRLEARVEAEDQMQAEALAALPSADAAPLLPSPGEGVAAKPDV
ncbi:hypothetical protein [Lichenifustis flavocetrariae]|uniref:Uncharacterized protein n=1 Tax=Lichenifustis flavocetrariae TaxID=2949735 RepID=A0AA41Z180_9HYPH|nr:hypothetical protein [Lichenifustis flavocetrariae]MCW6510980.1 hypothetical protein [Lichenifustis flavocetrariae]